jgi:uncharacterized protein
VLRDWAGTERHFGFHYRIEIEIFVPAAKRRYGYYLFPVMQGARMIGRVEARRSSAVLCVTLFGSEAGGSYRHRTPRRAGVRVRSANARLAGVDVVDYARD